jgi:hypothetical protein
MVDTSTRLGRLRWRLAWLWWDVWGRRKHKPTVYRYVGFGVVWESTLEDPSDKRIIWREGE